MVVSNIVKSWLVQGFQIPSILFGIFTLYYLLMDRALRNALNNHVIIAMVFVGLTLQCIDVSALAYYWRTGTVLLSTRAFCFAWTLIRSTGIAGTINLVAWASIERHILIFHPNLVRTKTKRFFLHYLPLVICMMCPGVFYFTIFFIVPCSVTMNYKIVDCGYYACIGVNPSVSLRCGAVRPETIKMTRPQAGLTAAIAAIAQ
ncbi:unnamed protein product [Adineta steineri]|uniref:G-protein coupled receptors family 1 profile domain-containing protein n=1 Tax=Adineta steineri TaxID=433720 RepID=A0A819U2B0_9BILA|nr:unnamed protein product [Adineta steineri]